MNFRSIKFLLSKDKLMHFNLLSILVLAIMCFGFVLTFVFINQYSHKSISIMVKIRDIFGGSNNKNVFADL